MTNPSPPKDEVSQNTQKTTKKKLKLFMTKMAHIVYDSIVKVGKSHLTRT